MDDSEAYEFYRDSANQVPAGPAIRRAEPRLTAAVPVRFPQPLIDAVKRLADRDGMTVSSWIRKLVAREVMRRQPAAVTMSSSHPARFEGFSTGSDVPTTLGPDAPDRLDLECFA
jgi:hypothetical protein